jgi:hypothetical protein
VQNENAEIGKELQKDTATVSNTVSGDLSNAFDLFRRVYENMTVQKKEETYVKDKMDDDGDIEKCGKNSRRLIGKKRPASSPSAENKGSKIKLEGRKTTKENSNDDEWQKNFQVEIEEYLKKFSPEPQLEELQKADKMFDNIRTGINNILAKHLGITSSEGL